MKLIEICIKFYQKIKTIFLDFRSFFKGFCLFSELRSLPYYEERLCQLGLWSLEERRRNRTDLIELFKLLKGISGTVFFCISDNTYGTRGHSWKLSTNHCHCNVRLQFCSQRVVDRWNSVPGRCKMLHQCQWLQWMHSKDVWKEVVDTRWTSLKTTSLQDLSAARPRIASTEVGVGDNSRRTEAGAALSNLVSKVPYGILWNIYILKLNRIRNYIFYAEVTSGFVYK